MEQLQLPVESEELLAVHEAARADALAKFERERFGGQLAALREGLEAAIAREHRSEQRRLAMLEAFCWLVASKRGTLHCKAMVCHA